MTSPTNNVQTDMPQEVTQLEGVITGQAHELWQLRAVIDNLPFAAFWKDCDSVYQGGNRRFVADLALASTADLVGKTDDDLPWQPGEASLFQATDQRVIANGQAEYDGDETVVYADGRQEWFETYRIPLRNPNNDVAGILTVYHNITNRRLAEATVQAQAQQLLELSTPLIPVSDQILLMPLVGAIDPVRAQHMLEVLLVRLQQKHTPFAIVDITGVPMVDTSVAAALIRVAQATRLLGAQIILTGIRPEVAQVLVTIGANLSEIITKQTIQEGIAYVTRHIRPTS